MSLSTTTTSTLTGALAALRVSLPAVDLPLPPSCPTTESNVVVDGPAVSSQSSKPAWIRTSKPAESSPLVLGTDSSSWPALTESTTRKTNSDEVDGSTHTDGAPVSMAMPIIRPLCLQPSPRVNGNSNRGSAYNGGGNRRGGGVVPHHGNFGGLPYHNSGNYLLYPHHNFGFGGWEVCAPPMQHGGPPPPFRGLPMPALAPPQHRGHPLPRQRPSPPLNYPVLFTFQPPYVPPYMNPMGFQGILPPAPLPPHLQIDSHPHEVLPPVFIPGTDAHRAELLRQVHFYFSYQNLCKDVYLRQYMDENGWVPISLIAGFNRVRNLTNDIGYILDVLRTSTIVEVQGYKIRLRNNWKFWILPLQLSKTRSPD